MRRWLIAGKIISKMTYDHDERTCFRRGREGKQYWKKNDFVLYPRCNVCNGTRGGHTACHVPTNLNLITQTALQ